MLRTPPTRHHLMRVRRRLDRVRTAAELLGRKRSALVNELFRATRPVLESREAIAWQAAVAYAALVQAQADRGRPLLAALALPLREIEVELRLARTWGVNDAEVVAHDPIRRPVDERGISVGAAGPAATETAGQFERLTALILDSLSRELRIRRLVRALAETSRRWNLLERRVAPALASEARRIQSTLEEREREEQLRFRHLLERRPGGRPR